MWPFDQNNRQVYQQYAQAYNTGNYNGFDPNQSLGHVQQFMQSAPYNMQQQVYQQHFSQMPYDQRMLLAQRMPPQYAMDVNNPMSMAQSFARMGQEQPGLLQQVFNHPVLLGSSAVLAALVAKHVMNHHERYERGYDQNFQNQPYDYDPRYQNQGYIQQELNQERREVQEERRELRQEERREERQEERREERREEREEHHHHRREDYF